MCRAVRKRYGVEDEADETCMNGSEGPLSRSISGSGAESSGVGLKAFTFQVVSPSVAHATDNLTNQCRPFFPRIGSEDTDLESRKKPGPDHSLGDFRTKKTTSFNVHSKVRGCQVQECGIDWGLWSLHDSVRFPWGSYDTTETHLRHIFHLPGRREDS